MRTRIVVPIVSMIAALAAWFPPPASAQPADPTRPARAAPTLYTRLGGHDAIAAVTDEFIGRMLKDASLSRFFVGHSDHSKAQIRQLVVDQLCAATGGPCVYIGMDMKTSHKGLGITEADWTSAVNHLVGSLDKFKVPQKEKDDLLAIASSLKKDIVDRP